MDINMAVLEFLAEWRNPILDSFFSVITRLGEEFLFMAVALIVFWCGNKNRGYYLLVVGFAGTVANQALKLLFRIPRPWVRNVDFEPIASAKPAATGYSFPSGHTQTATGLYGGIAHTSKKNSVRISCIVIVVLVALSRLWLGVHTPMDVLFSLALGVILVMMLRPIFKMMESKPSVMYIVAGAMLLFTVANVIFSETAPPPSSVSVIEYSEEVKNIAEAQKNAWSLLGAAIGLPIIFFVDNKYLHFKGEATIGWQIVKVVAGLLLLLAVKEGLKIPLDMIFGELNIKHCIRYLFVVLIAGIAYPACFVFLPSKSNI